MFQKLILERPRTLKSIISARPINLSTVNYSKESKTKLEENIKNIEKKIIDLDIIKEEILLEIDKLKKSNELEIKFFKLLINTYKYEESQNNINYNVIQNLKDFEETFGLNHIQLISYPMLKDI